MNLENLAVLLGEAGELVDHGVDVDLLGAAAAR